MESSILVGLKSPASKANYAEIDLQTQKWTKIIHFVFIKVFLYAIVFQKLIFCFYLYYATDLGSEAFELPFPFWYILWNYHSCTEINQ